MAQGVEVEVYVVHVDVHLLLLFSPRLTINEAGDLHAQVSLGFSFIHRVPVYWGAIDEVQGIIHHSGGAFFAGRGHEGATLGVSMEESGEEAAVDVLAIGAQERATDIRDGLPRGNAFQDARPAALLLDLAFHVTLNRLRGQGSPLEETP